MSDGSRSLFWQLTLRNLRTASSPQGAINVWLVLTPLLLLAVYGFVFGVIFRARVPSGLDISFIVWLAAALWPWLAFSDGVQRGSHAIRQHSALVGKVAMRRDILASASQTSAFVLQLLGYLVVLVTLAVLGTSFSIKGVPYLVCLLATLYIFSLGLAFLFSAIQVFIRDLEQVLPTLFMFWFFLTPILYVPDMLPSQAASLLYLNPMTWWMNEIRAALFSDQWMPGFAFLGLLMTALLALWVGKTVFDRLSPHFEDFL